MDELLQELFEADVLNEDTRKQLLEAIKAQTEEAREAAREEAAADVRIELTEKYTQDKEQLIEAIDQKIGDMVEAEIAELKGDVEDFRDLEAEYAERVVENKAALANEVQEDMSMLVDKIDAFMEIKISEEFEELKEDIQAVRQNDLGRRIFEAVKAEYMADFHNQDDSAANYAELESRLAESQEALEEAEKLAAELEREIKLDKILSPLSGSQREVMETVLQNVSTGKLEEGYRKFLPRILREAKEESEKEDNDAVLSEGAEKVDESEATETLNEADVVVVNGDRASDPVDSQAEDKQLDESYKAEMNRFLRIAGITGDNA